MGKLEFLYTTHYKLLFKCKGCTVVKKVIGQATAL